MLTPRSFRLLPWFVASVTALACNPVEDSFSIEFATQDGINATSEIAITAFVPLLTPVDSDTPKFVAGTDVGVFPPTRMIDPESIQTFSNLGTVLEYRKNEPYPFDGSDWVVDFGQPDEGDANNPWGAVMLYVEARGEARTPDEKGSQSTATLLAGWDCIRTKEASHGDQQLDKAVKKACRLLNDPDADEPPRIMLGPVAPPEFKLTACDGVGTLTGARGQSLAPGPAVCLSAVRCDNIPDQSIECFDCMQPCSELDDLSNVPIIFTIDQPGGGSTPTTQVVLTDDQGRAQAPLNVDDGMIDIRVRAQVLGRTIEPVEFELETVDAVERFECVDDLALPDLFQPSAMTTIPGIPGACMAGNPNGCDQIAILRDDATSARLEVYHPSRPTPIKLDFDEKTAVGVHGFFYDLGPDGMTPSRPSIAVAVSGIEVMGQDNNDLRLYVFEFVNGQLVPHDGATGRLPDLCAGWLCGGTQLACTPNTPNACAADDYCYDGICVDDAAQDANCPGPSPAACRCRVDGVGFQTRVTMSARDVDGDKKADLTVATDSKVVLLFYRTATSTSGAMYHESACECGQFGQAPNAFALGVYGGDTPDPSLADIYIGATGGSYMKYGETFKGRSTLKCGNPSPLGDGMSVRDVVSGKFSCRIDDRACFGYDDVVTVAAKNITGGGPEDPGVVRMIIGSSEDLTSGQDPLERPGVRLDLFPRTLPEQTEPRDPQRARTGDFNGDGHLDLAVLYRASGEMHVWLGASNRGLGEMNNGIVLDECLVKRSETCTPMSEFAVGDFDGDLTSEIAVVCNAAGTPTLRIFDPLVNN